MSIAQNPTPVETPDRVKSRRRREQIRDGRAEGRKVYKNSEEEEDEKRNREGGAIERKVKNGRGRDDFGRKGGGERKRTRREGVHRKRKGNERG